MRKAARQGVNGKGLRVCIGGMPDSKPAVRLCWKETDKALRGGILTPRRDEFGRLPFPRKAEPATQPVADAIRVKVLATGASP